MKRILPSGQVVTLYQRAMRPTGKPRSGPPYCFSEVWRDCANDSCYLVFGDGSVYHYPAPAASSSVELTLANIHGEFFNHLMRRPTAAALAFERWTVPIPGTATKIYGYPPYAGTDPGPCGTGLSITITPGDAPYGTRQLFTARLLPADPTQTADVTFYDGSPSFGLVATPMAASMASVYYDALGIGVHGDIYATYDPLALVSPGVSVSITAIPFSIFSTELASAYAACANAGYWPGDTCGRQGDENYPRVWFANSPLSGDGWDVIFDFFICYVELYATDVAGFAQLALYQKDEPEPRLVYGNYTKISDSGMPGGCPDHVTVTAT